MTTVFFQTYGCSLNHSDSEVMQGLLVQEGFTLVDAPEQAEVIVINTCAVKQPTENKFFKYLEEAKQLNRPIVVAGCIAQTMPGKLKGYGLIGPNRIQLIRQVIEDTMHKDPVKELSDERQERLNLPKVRRNPAVEIIPICAGCLGACSYCIVRRARGRLHSYSKREIVRQAQSAIKDGVAEIWLTAQDTGCYGRDTGTCLPSLIRDIVAIPGDFRVRIGMMNPNNAIDMVEDLAEALRSPKVFRFLHLPVQSGNDEILKQMKRNYTVDDFRGIVARLRKAIPDLTVATDIICGFPGETQEQYRDSVELVNRMKPDVLNISRFWARPRTHANRMKPLPGDVTKERSRALTSVFHWVALANNKTWMGWEGSAIVDEHGKNGSFVARNDSYKPIIIDGKYRLGERVRVRVELATPHDLRGAVLCRHSQEPLSSS